MAIRASKGKGVAGPAPADATLDDPDLAFRLALEDLQPGAQGEVVLFNDSALRGIVLEAGSADYTTGSVREHVTTEGIDVSGYSFVRFHDGLVVYHTPDTEVTVVRA